MSSNVYAAEPAFPVLAHNLLTESTSPCWNPETQHETETDQSGIWNLKDDIDNAFESPSSLFQWGRVISFSKLRNRIQDDEHELIGQLPRYILTKYLLSTPSPKAFIIHPASSFPPFSPKSLLASLLPSLSRDNAIPLLDHVQLLPVFDFVAVTHAIASVADTLHAAEGTAEGGGGRTLLLVAGLDTLAEGIIRASSPLRAAAALAAVLRTLTLLTRSRGIAVMLVNTSGLGSGSASVSNAIPAEFRSSVSEGEGVYSTFHATTLLPTLLMRTLDQGVDVHVLLSAVGRDYVLEVVKDRGGEGVGKWCVWDV